jgi:hypothetical protein
LQLLSRAIATIDPSAQLRAGPAFTTITSGNIPNDHKTSAKLVSSPQDTCASSYELRSKKGQPTRFVQKFNAIQARGLRRVRADLPPRRYAVVFQGAP